MLREVLARFGIDVDSAQILTGISSLGNLAGQALRVARVIGQALFRAIRDVTLEMAEFGDETAKTARQLGVGADQLLAWRFAAERSGVDANQLTTGLRRLQRNIVDAGEGVDTAVRAFRDLGVEFRDSEGGFREIEDILPDLADGFRELESDTQRSARAQQIFGRAGAQLLPFLEGGSEGIRELQRRFDELGGNLGEDFFSNAEEAQDAMADFELASTAAKASLATELLPALTTIVTSVADLVGWINRTLDRTDFLRNGIRVLGIALGILATVVGIVLAPALLSILTLMAPIILTVGILALAIDELITLFSGGDSIIGRFLDAMFGAGTAASIAEAVQAAWTDFVAWLTTVGVPAIQRFGRFLVGLWPRVRPALRAVGRFLVQTFRFLAGLPERVRGIVDEVVGFFNRLAARVQAVANQIRSTIQGITQGAQDVLGFFGIEVGANGPAPTPGARPGATVAPGARGGDTSVEQRNEISINGTDLSPDEIQRRVTDAIREANERALRVASRALTTVGG